MSEETATPPENESDNTPDSQDPRTSPDTAPADAAEESRSQEVEQALAELQSVDPNDRNAVAPAVTALGNGDTEAATEALRGASVSDRQPIVNALGLLEGNKE